MSECCYLICYVSVTTYGTSVGSVTTVYAIRSSYNSLVIVSECCYLIRHVSVTTYGTSMSGVTTVYAVRSSYNSLVIVSKCVNNSLLNKDLTANRALLALAKTGQGTGRCYRRYNFFCVVGAKICFAYIADIVFRLCIGMSERTNSITNVVITTGSTCVGSVTAVYTIGSSYNLIIAVSKCRNFSLRNKGFTTSSAHLTVGKTGVSTSGSFAYYGLLSVSKCRDLGLCNKSFTASGTYLTFGKTAFGTSRCPARHCLFSMTNSCGLI